jgi:acetyl-CoA/propionyl-CoA carboxylase, biotin carboxylase, biotin carboxyl carrier protein
MFTKVLVANRGEIAIRVMRALEEMEIASVGVYSELDRDAAHVARADEAYLLGPGPAAESYLKIEKILEVASQAGAEAVHPGYGFLAENAAFAQACSDAGITFIGPPAAAIEAMGSKTAARALMQKAGVPIVPGTTEPVPDLKAARKAIDQDIGYPVAVKAAGGGGGKGFRVALSEDELEEAFEGASREGEKFFSDPTVYLERYLPDPRHVEVQVLADTHGNVIHLGERDCSVQRRHQKLCEESPAPLLPAETREGLRRAALTVAAAVNYVNAGTVEFLVDGDGQFYFIEMNTRIQVEHPVTELLTGIDLVREQIRIASGEPLGYRQDAVRFEGHAIECRINAEDPETFAPSAGRVTAWVPPGGFNVRVDSHLMAPYAVPPFYDSLLAKIVVRGADRAEAIDRMRRALRETVLEGVKTSIPFHLRLMDDAAFLEGRVSNVELVRRRS